MSAWDIWPAMEDTTLSPAELAARLDEDLAAHAAGSCPHYRAKHASPPPDIHYAAGDRGREDDPHDAARGVDDRATGVPRPDQPAQRQHLTDHPFATTLSHVMAIDDLSVAYLCSHRGPPLIGPQSAASAGR